MKIIIGSDHAGFDLKQIVVNFLQGMEIEVNDKGTHSNDSADYPDFAHPVASEVESSDSLGILICGSANGVCMTANKHIGIRAAIAWMPEIASLARQHNDANILCIPSRYVTEDEAKEIVKAFLNNSFDGGRHLRRVEKIPCA